MTATAAATQSSDDVVTVMSDTVACEGTADTGGHPRVFLKIDAESRETVCPYCSRTFKLDPNAKTGHH